MNGVRIAICLANAVLLTSILAGCQSSPEYLAIQNQYVGSDTSNYGRSPLGSATGNLISGIKDKPQMRCAVVQYDAYGHPACAAIKLIR